MLSISINSASATQKVRCRLCQNRREVLFIFTSRIGFDVIEDAGKMILWRSVGASWPTLKGNYKERLIVISLHPKH